MDATTQQLVLVLTQQNMMLMQEVAALKAELAKRSTEVVAPTKPAKAVKAKKEVDPNHVKNPARIETGKKLAEWNSRKKLVRESFAAWKSLMQPQDA